VAISDFLIFKVNAAPKRLEGKIKMVWILYIEIKEKIRLCEGDRTETDSTKSKGWIIQYPIRTRHETNGKGKQE
jgi:hypothetical protein